MGLSDYIQGVVLTEGGSRDMNDRWTLIQASIANQCADPLFFDPVRVLHASIGLSSEIHELEFELKEGDKENLIEELGDICWYAAVALDALPSEFPIVEMLRDEHGKSVYIESVRRAAPVAASESGSDGFTYDLSILRMLIGDFSGYAKASVFYNRRYDKPSKLPISWILRQLAESMITMVYYIGRNHAGVSAGEIMARNNWKLVSGPKARYKKGKFTAAQANERRDKQDSDERPFIEAVFNFEKGSDTDRLDANNANLEHGETYRIVGAVLDSPSFSGVLLEGKRGYFNAEMFDVTRPLLVSIFGKQSGAQMQ